jgi:hypothetical protein
MSRPVVSKSPIACAKHRENPVKGYAACAGCEVEALRAENERLTREQGEGTTSNKYRAELYDEVWQRARDMGFANVTMALSELAALKAVPDGVVAWMDEGIGAFISHDCKQYGQSRGGAPGHAVGAYTTALMIVAQHNARMAEKDAQIEALRNERDSHAMELDALRQPVADEREAPGWANWCAGDTVRYVSAGDFIHARMTVGSDYLIQEVPDDHETMVVLDDDGDELGVLVGEFEWQARAALSAPAAGQGVSALVELLSWLRGAIDCNPKNDTEKRGVWISTKHPMIQRIDAALAAHKAGEVKP